MLKLNRYYVYTAVDNHIVSWSAFKFSRRSVIYNLARRYEPVCMYCAVEKLVGIHFLLSVFSNRQCLHSRRKRRCSKTGLLILIRSGGLMYLIVIITY